MARRKVSYNDNSFAIAYYRFSSAAQNEMSIDQQREAAEEYAAAHGFRIIKEYADAALSGTTDARPEFQLMLHEIGSLKPAALILWKTDRLGRDRYDLAIAKKKIRDAGCRIHYVAEKTPDENSPEDAFMEGILESMAEYYSRQLSVNVSRGMKFNAERCLWNGSHPYGYKKGPEKSVIIDEDAAPVVQQIFHAYADGKSMSEICDELNNAGLRSKKGNKFTVNSVRGLLKNRAFLGEYRYGKDIVIPDGIPRLVSDDLFTAVQQRLALNRRVGSQKARGIEEDGSVRFWLSGKLYCGECGEPMHGVSGRSHTGRKFLYYACNDHHKGKRGKGCKKKDVRKEWIEKTIIRVLVKFLEDPGNVAALAADVAEYYKREYEDTSYIDSLQAKLKESETALNNVMKAIIAGASGDTVNRQLNELEAQKKSLQDAIDAEVFKRSMIHDEVSIQKFFGKYKTADFENPEIRDTIFEYFIDKIYLYDDHMKITAWYNDERTEIEIDALYGGRVEVDNVKNKGSTASSSGPLEKPT